MKYKVLTLGCRTNQYESEGYKTQLNQLGYEQVGEGEQADLCIVNTCTVTESADSSSRRQIRRLARQNPGAKLVVTGCMVESHPELGIEGITHIVPNKKKEDLIKILFPDAENLPEFKIDQFDAHTRAFVKVQDGCNSYCTYCIIPYVRGRSRSRSIPEVLDEIRGLVEKGYKEVVLTGINIGDFEEGLAKLIRAVDKIDGLERIRVSSIDPDEVDDDLADAILSGDKTCPSMHIVLQAGSNVVLKRMNRKYTRQEFMRTIERMRAAHPDFTFTTDIIVGFPGESERDFEETLDVMDQVHFAKVHMFPYSERPRTRAAQYPNKVPQWVIEERRQLVMRRAEQSAFALREQYVGRTMFVLAESADEGHTTNFLNVKLPKGVRANEIVEVKLTKNTPEGLLGAYVH